MKILAALLLLAAAPPDLEKKVEECAGHAFPRFVFFGGGSGVLISGDGYCLTNHHVAGNRKTTRVTLHDGRVLPARRVCTDVVGDLSLFKIEAGGDEEFPFFEFGDSDALEPGRYVVACGNPFGLALPDEDRKMYPSVTLGIVSAIHRGQGGAFDVLQTDAAVNPGNSGGPLLTLDGRLVGITSRIATRFYNRVNSGVGYAIPSRQILNFLPEMKKGGLNGRVYHGEVTGLVLAGTDSAGEGARVTGVKTGSPAEEAGFRRGDLVVGVDRYPVFNRERFLGAIGSWPMGTEVKIRVRRDGAESILAVRLGRKSADDDIWSLFAPPRAGRPRAYLGVTVEGTKAGVAVVDVRPGSPAEEAGLRVGDILKKMDGRAVSGTTDFSLRLRARRPGDRLPLTVLRGGEETDLAATLARPPGE